MNNKRKMMLLIPLYMLLLTGCSEDIVNAGYNTLLGMGMAFLVLIIISLVIMIFPMIGKMGDRSSGDKRLKSIDKTIEHIEKQESGNKPASSVTVVNDFTADEEEMAAVFAAAIAAYEEDTGHGVTAVNAAIPMRGVLPLPAAVPDGYEGFYARPLRHAGSSSWKRV